MPEPRTVTLIYHWEPEGWWADSPDLPGFSAAGATYTDVRHNAIEGAEFAADEPVFIVEATASQPCTANPDGQHAPPVTVPPELTTAA